MHEALISAIATTNDKIVFTSRGRANFGIQHSHQYMQLEPFLDRGGSVSLYSISSCHHGQYGIVITVPCDASKPSSAL